MNALGHKRSRLRPPVKMALLAITVVFFICLLYGLSSKEKNYYRLDIVHYNDFHARFEETSVQTPTCRFNNNSCLGGFSRLYHEIQVLRKEKPECLLLNAGDSFQGTYWYTLLKWNITQIFMNLLQHDAHAIGNHEFDDGPEGLAPYLAALKAPVLAANMDVSGEPCLRGLFKNSTVVERNGKRIGLIGLITTDTKKLSSPGKVVFTDPGEATEREAKLLTEQGVDIIVLLSHCGLDVDKELAKNYSQYIDVIVGGHTHSLLWNGLAPSGEPTAGPYPIIVNTTADYSHKVLIVQASAFTKYMGNLSIYFDDRGHYVHHDGGPIFLNRSIAEDPKISKDLEPYAEIVHKAENVAIGVTKNTLSFEDCVYGECALGDLMVDAFNNNTKSRLNSSYDYLSFIQRGNIKSSVPAGNITLGTIFELLPYNDKIITFMLKGNYVLEALEHSVSDAWEYDPFKGPWVLQVSGLRVEYNISKPENQRVISVSIGGVDSNKALDPNSYYQVTAPKYLADGGDGFTMFSKGRQTEEIVGNDQSVLTECIKKLSPLDIKTDGRIRIVQRNITNSG